MLKFKSPLRALLITTALTFQNGLCLANQNPQNAPSTGRKYLEAASLLPAQIAISGVTALVAKTLEPSTWLAITAAPFTVALAITAMNRCLKKFNLSTYPELEDSCDSLCGQLTPFGIAITAISFAGKYANLYALAIPATIITTAKSCIKPR